MMNESQPNELIIQETNQIFGVARAKKLHRLEEAGWRMNLRLSGKGVPPVIVTKRVDAYLHKLDPQFRAHQIEYDMLLDAVVFLGSK